MLRSRRQHRILAVYQDGLLAVSSHLARQAWIRWGRARSQARPAGAFVSSDRHVAAAYANRNEMRGLASLIYLVELQGPLLLDPEQLRLVLLAKLDPRFRLWRDLAGAASGFFTCEAAKVTAVYACREEAT